MRMRTCVWHACATMQPGCRVCMHVCGNNANPCLTIMPAAHYNIVRSCGIAGDSLTPHCTSTCKHRGKHGVNMLTTHINTAYMYIHLGRRDKTARLGCDGLAIIIIRGDIAEASSTKLRRRLCARCGKLRKQAE